MTHDPLCPCKPQVIGHGSTSGDVQAAAPAVACQCDLITKVRQDERERDDGQSVILASDCEKQIARAESDMLAKCVATVEAMDIHGSHPYRGVVHCNCLGSQIVAALRSLQEKP